VKNEKRHNGNAPQAPSHLDAGLLNAGSPPAQIIGVKRRGMQFNQIVTWEKEKAMQFIQSNKQTFASSIERAGKRAGILSLIILAAFGALAAAALTKQYDASCEVEVELYKKGDNGAWMVIDRAKSGLNARMSILDMAVGNMVDKEVTTGHTWRARSEQGREISVKLAGKARGRLDVASGAAYIDIPFEVNVDGHRMPLNSRMTNQRTNTPVGEMSGNKTEISGSTMSGGMSGFNEIKPPNLIAHLLKRKAKNEVPRDKESKTNRSMNPPAHEPLVVVFKMRGRAIAVK
jgi:hypothetical protein